MSNLEPIKKKFIRQSKRLKDKDVDLFDNNSTVNYLFIILLFCYY